MQILIEENSNPTNSFNEFNMDTAERVADRNRRLKSEGKVPHWIVIGVAESPALVAGLGALGN
jgi:hypothetical protein